MKTQWIDSLANYLELKKASVKWKADQKEISTNKQKE